MKFGVRSDCQSTERASTSLPRAVQHAHLHAADIAGVLAHLGDDVFLQDGQRHGPGRIEIHRGDGRGQRRRRAIDLADHRDVAPRHLAVLHRLGDGGRNVHHHVALAEGEAEPVQPVERGGELADARLHRDVERLDGLRADRAGLGQAVARLEALHRLGQHRVVGVALGDLDRQVLGDGEARAQLRDIRARRAGIEIDLGDLRPAAAHLQRRIGEHRGVDAVVGAFVEGRLGRGPEARDAALYWLGLRQRGLRGGWRLLREGGRGRETKRYGEQNCAEHGALPVNPTRALQTGPAWQNRGGRRSAPFPGDESHERGKGFIGGFGCPTCSSPPPPMSQIQKPRAWRLTHPTAWSPWRLDHIMLRLRSGRSINILEHHLQARQRRTRTVSSMRSCSHRHASTFTTQ